MEQLKLRDFLDYKFISGTELSPDGKKIGFVIHTSDYDKNKYRSNIWVYDTESKNCRKLTSMDAEKSFIWLDDSTILFSAVRNEDIKKKIEDKEEWTCYYSIRTDGGEAEEYMRLPVSASSVRPLSDDKFAVVYSYDHFKESKADADSSEDYEVIDEIPFWENGGTFTNKIRSILSIYDKKTGAFTDVSDKYSNIQSIDVDAEKKKILYTSNYFTDKSRLHDNIYLYDVTSGSTVQLIPANTYSVEFARFIDDKIVFMGSTMDAYGMNQNMDLYLIDEGKIRLIAHHDYGFSNTVGSDCRYGSGSSVRIHKDRIYIISTEAKCSYIKEFTLEGTVRKQTGDLGSIDSFDIGEDAIYFTGMRGMRLQEIYELRDSEEKRLTDFNENIVTGKSLSCPESLRFTNVGTELEGFVIKPVNFDKSRQYPAILDIHGGPKTVFGEVYFHEMQYWANEGYFVFFMNPRGSDGRGNEFADIRGKYGTIDYDDLMKFADLVLDKYPQIDSSRIGVTGGSYGGFMTNWIIGHTDRFRCAAAQRSIANWVTEFAVTDIGHYFVPDQMAATPWSDIEKLWFHSPLKYADMVKTPTLFIHSAEDYRCWLPEGLQMFTALKYHGVEARLCMFKGENHELSRSGKPKHRVRRLEEITNWFEKYLK